MHQAVSIRDRTQTQTQTQNQQSVSKIGLVSCRETPNKLPHIFAIASPGTNWSRQYELHQASQRGICFRRYHMRVHDHRINACEDVMNDMYACLLMNFSNHSAWFSAWPCVTVSYIRFPLKHASDGAICKHEWQLGLHPSPGQVNVFFPLKTSPSSFHGRFLIVIGKLPSECYKNLTKWVLSHTYCILICRMRISTCFLYLVYAICWRLNDFHGLLVSACSCKT